MYIYTSSSLSDWRKLPPPMFADVRSFPIEVGVDRKSAAGIWMRRTSIVLAQGWRPKHMCKTLYLYVTIRNTLHETCQNITHVMKRWLMTQQIWYDTIRQSMRLSSLEACPLGKAVDGGKFAYFASTIRISPDWDKVDDEPRKQAWWNSSSLRTRGQNLLEERRRRARHSSSIKEKIKTNIPFNRYNPQYQ